MVEWLVGQLERVLPVPAERIRSALNLLPILLGVAVMVGIATFIIAYDSLFNTASWVSRLQVGDIVPQDIRAPYSVPSFVSPVLTEQQRRAVQQGVAEIYFPPDPSVARRQVDYARQVLLYVDTVRRDPFSSPSQKTDDLRLIAELALDAPIIDGLLALGDADWQEVSTQITEVLERVMRGEIRERALDAVLARLPMQVSVRFSETQANIIVAFVSGLIRPNTLLNEDATEAARAEATVDLVVRRSIERSQIVARGGEPLDEAGYEALGLLGLLEPGARRLQAVGKALVTSVLVLVMVGLYLARFRTDMFKTPRLLALLGAILLIVLLGSRLTGSFAQFYLYPTAVLALMYTALVGADLAVIGTLALAMLMGIMRESSLEVTLLTGVGGMMAAMTLRRPERLNGYFLPGVLVGLANIVVAFIFQVENATADAVLDVTFLEIVLHSALNGVLAAAITLVGIYIVTLLFNLTTGLKLVELSQPNQPLLQRLLREAPGTYQHSLQVANMTEQAANAIGANADLVRVSALYHDIGKMLNPAFFTENQVEGVNPHDALNDPARSADIIIGHVTEGEKMARQYRLPARIRDFILEHHGTQVLHFYYQAVERAGDDDAIDMEQFTYPGPKPQSRETALLMLADSCEAAVRSRKPQRKQEIVETIQQIFESKIQSGQLDESGLTLKDIYSIRRTFADMLQAVFHPRINYPVQSQSGMRETLSDTGRTPLVELALPSVEARRSKLESDGVAVVAPLPESNGRAPKSQQSSELPVVRLDLNEPDEPPLQEVPPLMRSSEPRSTRTAENPTPRSAPEEQ